MYTDKLLSVYLNKSKLNMVKGPLNQLIPYEATIGEWCQWTNSELRRLHQLPPNYRPDFQMEGRLIPNGKGNPMFNGDVSKSNPATHMLYITGVNTQSSLEPFRLSDAVYSSYWEDSIKGLGYLFQVIEV